MPDAFYALPDAQFQGSPEFMIAYTFINGALFFFFAITDIINDDDIVHNDCFVDDAFHNKYPFGSDNLLYLR
jgi:hypothetical protein